MVMTGMDMPQSVNNTNVWCLTVHDALFSFEKAVHYKRQMFKGHVLQNMFQRAGDKNKLTPYIIPIQKQNTPDHTLAGYSTPGLPMKLTYKSNTPGEQLTSAVEASTASRKMNIETSAAEGIFLYHHAEMGLVSVNYINKKNSFQQMREGNLNNNESINSESTPTNVSSILSQQDSGIELQCSIWSLPAIEGV
jgi:hypothetical protein